jgi:hypothetical protein
LGGQGSLTGHSNIGPCGLAGQYEPRQPSGRTSGKGGPSPDLPPPRTVRATCAAHGSSLRHLVGGAEDPVPGAPYGSLRHGPIVIGPLHRLASVGPFGSHRLTSPIGFGVQTLRFRRGPPEICALSGRVSPARAGPIRPITGRPSLAPALLYPLRHPPPSRSGYRRLAAAGRVGLTLLPDVERRMGRLRPIVRRVTAPPSPRVPNRRSDPRAILAPAYQHLWPVLDHGP